MRTLILALLSGVASACVLSDHGFDDDDAPVTRDASVSDVRIPDARGPDAGTRIHVTVFAGELTQIDLDDPANDGKVAILHAAGEQPCPATVGLRFDTLPQTTQFGDGCRGYRWTTATPPATGSLGVVTIDTGRASGTCTPSPQRTFGYDCTVTATDLLGPGLDVTAIAERVSFGALRTQTPPEVAIDAATRSRLSTQKWDGSEGVTIAMAPSPPAFTTLYLRIAASNRPPDGTPFPFHLQPLDPSTGATEYAELTCLVPSASQLTIPPAHLSTTFAGMDVRAVRVIAAITGGSASGSLDCGPVTAPCSSTPPRDQAPTV